MGGAGFHARGSGEDFGAYLSDDGEVGGAFERRVGIAGQRDGVGAALAGFLMWRVGHALGPPDPRTVAATADDFDPIPSDLAMSASPSIHTSPHPIVTTRSPSRISRSRNPTTAAVPIVMAGGKKLPDIDALTMAYNAVQQGAAGVDMGRNIFQSEAPKAMIAAVAAVVHKTMRPKDAFDLYKSLKADGDAMARAAE